MNRHLAIKMSCFCVLELRNNPAHALMPTLGRLESEHFNHNLFDPDLIRGSLAYVQNAPRILMCVSRTKFRFCFNTPSACGGVVYSESTGFFPNIFLPVNIAVIMLPPSCLSVRTTTKMCRMIMNMRTYEA
jgi:hypothetical protein